MLTKEEIQKILQSQVSKELVSISDEPPYVGFDMGVTTGEEPNIKSQRHNSDLLKYFKVDERLFNHIFVWKGSIWIAEYLGGESLQDYGGWSSSAILEDIINHQYNYLYLLNKLKKEKEEPKEEKIVIISRVIEPRKRYEVLKRQKWSCNTCGTKLKYNKKSNFGDEVAHIDHIHPYSKLESYPNGAENINELSNLQALCPKCNKEKSNKEIH